MPPGGRDHGRGLPGLLAKVGRREGILPLVNTRLLRVRGQTRLRARRVRRACRVTRVRVQVRGSPALLLPLKPTTMTRSLALTLTGPARLTGLGLTFGFAHPTLPLGQTNPYPYPNLPLALLTCWRELPC